MRGKILFSLLFLLAATSVAAAPPKRIVILVLDQLRSDYIDKYNLTHLQDLRNHSIHFTNANVGHFPTVTLMSHPAIATGLFPKHYGWNAEIYHDTKGIIGPKGLWYEMGSLSPKDFRKIMKSNIPQPAALSLIKKKLKGHVYAIGEKNYAAITMGGIDADSVITLTKAMKKGPWKGWCIPLGINIPSYITQPKGGRFYIDCRNDYGTENTLYPLGGNRFVPGDDSKHLGGDIWTADAALAVMQQDPQWRILLITMGAIDKLAHVYGEMDNPTQQKKAKHARYHLEEILKIADEQAERIITHLKKSGLWEETLFVLAADHGGLSSAKHFYGDRQKSKGEQNDLFGKFADLGFIKTSKIASEWIKPDIVDHATLSTIIQLWLTDIARKNPDQQCQHFSKMPGAIAVYKKVEQKGNWKYKICTKYHGPAMPPFLAPIPILNTSAMDTAADLVVQLADDTGYSLLGDHGGLQEKSLRIPLIMHLPDGIAKKNECPIRLVDLMPIIMTQLQMPIPSWLDGSSTCLN